MHVKIKITTERNFDLPNDVIEKEISRLKEEEDLRNLLRVCIVEDKKFKIRRLHVLIAVIVLVLIATVTTLTAVFTSLKPEYPPFEERNDSLIIKRAEWFAENSTEVIQKLSIFPAPYVIIIHTVSKECNTTYACKSQVRSTQAFHIELNFGDIGYNFLIGGDGHVYEGLGWNAHGAHTIPFNGRSIGVAFIGNFVEKAPPKKQVDAAQLLLEEGLRTHKLTPNYKVFGHSQIIATLSPGDKLMAIVKTWPHWTEYDPKVDG